MAQTRGENRLISLIHKAKSACQSIAGAVRSDLKNIEEARLAGMKWAEIADGLGFTGKDFEVRRAYSREIARQEKKGDVKPSPRPTVQKTENGKQNEVIPAGTKRNGGRIGTATPIGRGRLDLGEDTPDNEL